jgi:beta-glucanase (GH16 family)
MKTYTSRVWPGTWTLTNESVIRSGRCIDCNDHIEVVVGTFENTESGQLVHDKERLCSCDASYGYDFKEEVTHAL